jgi:hypothetical protein
MARRLIAVAAACIAAVVSTGAPVVRASVQAAPNLPPELTRAIAYYSTLTSYADTGTIVLELPGVVDTLKTATYFRRPTRDLYLEVHGVSSVNPATRFTVDMSATRHLIWMFKGDMQTYDSRTGSRELVRAEGGGQVRALQNGSYATRGISMLIPALLYSQSGLPGTISQIEQASVAGIEDVDTRRCHKIVGVAAAYYPSGQRTDIRPVTVWIDAETRLIRKVFEDTPEGYPANSFQRKTITLQPRANPPLEDSMFQFKVRE